MFFLRVRKLVSKSVSLPQNKNEVILTIKTPPVGGVFYDAALRAAFFLLLFSLKQQRKEAKETSLCPSDQKYAVYAQNTLTSNFALLASLRSSNKLRT
jgi:hypothetical protein